MERMINITEKPKRVAEYVGVLQSGGIEKYAMNILDSLKESGCQFDYIVENKQKTDWDDYITSRHACVVGILDRNASKNKIKRKLAKYKNIKRIFRDNKYDIAEIHMSYPSTLLYCRIAKKCGIKRVIAHAHSAAYGKVGVLEKVVSWFCRLFFLRYCDFLLAPSNSSGSFMFGKKARFICAKNGISVKEFKFNSEARSDFRKKYNIGDDTIVVGHVGRFERAKNHSFIIKVFCIFHKNHPNSILLLVGDGTLKSDIKKLVDTFELTSSVIFLDKTSAIANAMMAMDVFVMPSLAEGLGIVAIEAQTTGLPIVVSNGVPSEAHVTDRCCALSLDMPPIVWSEKLYELLSISCESRLAYSKRVYDKGYDIKTVSEQMMHIFLD